MKVEITQFLPPNGKQAVRFAEVPDDCAVGYEALKRKGCRLTAEVLLTGLVSQCIEHDDGDFAIAVCENGPAVQNALVDMMRKFDGAEFDKWLEAVNAGCEFDEDGVAF